MTAVSVATRPRSDKMAAIRDRIWVYGKGEWLNPWPSLGDDEHGRRTLVVPLPGRRALVVAYRYCRCEGCDETREQTAHWERDLLAARSFCRHADDQGYPCDACLDLVEHVSA